MLLLLPTGARYWSMANNLVQSVGCTAGAELIIKSNMGEGLSVRERPSTGYYKELHNFTSDNLHKTKKGKRRKAPEDVYYEVEIVISRRVTKGTVKHEYIFYITMITLMVLNKYWL